MAQLRDARTSQIATEGTPEQVALAAELLGSDEVLFDGVGEHFDASAVVAAYRTRVAGLEAAAANAEGEDAQRLSDAHQRAAAVETAEVPALVGEAERAITEARGQLDA